ncbi:MAG: hypothetical protein JO121_25440 [Deltaproteobacteria bacterium]|nr:hypothetical protein [Deltaproteobacteria bacterium]
MLVFAQAGNIDRGECAVAATSTNPADSSNDPAHAEEWDLGRDLRASLIRWLATDRTAAPLVDPKGLCVLGARVTGSLDLSGVRVPFGVRLVRCSIPDVINLSATDVPSLSLEGSYTGEILAVFLTSHEVVNFGSDALSGGQFSASGVVNLTQAKAKFFRFSGGHFHYSEKPRFSFGDPAFKTALFLLQIESRGDVELCCGFESNGAVLLNEAHSSVGDLNCSGGRFFNPGNVALDGGGASFGWVVLGPIVYGVVGPSGFEANGAVNFANTRVRANFLVDQAKFSGKSKERHGLYAPGLSVGGAFTWRNVDLPNGASLELTGARMTVLIDEPRSWPVPGQLFIDGLTYQQFGIEAPLDSPRDAGSRLRWLALQPTFHPQPYRQLAQVLAAGGDDVGATQVRIAAEDLRYSRYGIPGRIWGAFLKNTIGYGHRPMLTIMWSLAMVVIGWLIVRAAKAAAVMRPTYPDNALAAGDRRYERLYPLLYSLDVFLPFVNLHHEHYWWPDADAAGRCRVFGQTLNLRGSVVLYYLWAQIIAGWILSAIFVAGVTGLIRGD